MNPQRDGTAKLWSHRLLIHRSRGLEPFLTAAAVAVYSEVVIPIPQDEEVGTFPDSSSNRLQRAMPRSDVYLIRIVCF
ncbi:hypothetical protein PoB_004340900 [Plakobranchus ocellatus]|uniref:Uncharacterized protein n=1 Tax=Plakobranchus ocellatus TaxID=259542 RepID=A0AAV4BEW0_9GAST|nr:hypothetical protein PoB_004340900 [Plakobranchus ocellatus]